MTNVTSSAELARLLLDKAKAASTGKDLTGAETLCRCTETFIKLARLEMELSGTVRNGTKQLAATTVWTPLDATALLDSVDDDVLKAAVKAGEHHLQEIEDAIERVSNKSPKHIAVKMLSAEATYLRTYLLGLRDSLS